MSDAKHFQRIFASVVVACSCVMWATACSSNAVSVQGTRVDVTVRDFRIDTPATVPSGTVTFVVHGTGPMLHEFNVAWTDLGAKDLPLANDDTVADKTDTPHFKHLGEVEGIEMGSTKTLTVQLDPGKQYVFYCNMEGHYMAGMTQEVTAT
jgi:uncharacterized cupredoxin-like copper-binding protein